MAPRTLPGIGLQGFAPKGEDSWNVWMDQNMRLVSALLQGRVKSLVAVVPPSGFADGDMHLLTGAPNANAIALRDNGAWVYVTPETGWRMYDMENALYWRFDGTAWVAENANLSATSAAPALELKKRGSAAGVLAPNAAYSELGFFRWLGWTGSVWRTGAQILVQTQELWSGAANGTAIVFQVIANGATGLVDRLQLTASALLPAQTDLVVSLGGSTTRWLKGWFGNVSMFPAASVTPTVNGEVTFQLTSNTSLAVKVKGSDGVVRTGTITLS